MHEFLAKNIILAGVKTIAIYDNEPVAIRDMTSNFYITEEDIGKPRAEVGMSRFCDHLGVPTETQRAEPVCHSIST